MKIITTLLILLLFSSCGISYDGEIRLVNEFRVTDSSGQPLSGIPVVIEVGVDGLSQIISNGTTDENGNLRLIFPAPSDLNATINFRIAGNYPEFPEKIYQNIIRSDYQDYKIKLDNIVLYKPEELTNLYVTTQQSNSNRQLKSLQIISGGNAAIVDYQQLSSEIQTAFSVVKNQSVTLGYTTIDYSFSPPTEIDQTVLVPIGIDNVEYILNY